MTLPSISIRVPATSSGWELRLLDHTKFPSELQRVERQHVAAGTIGDSEVDDFRHTMVMASDRAHLSDEDPVAACSTGLLEPDWFQSAGFDD
jgi:hypothetical protein